MGFPDVLDLLATPLIYMTDHCGGMMDVHDIKEQVLDLVVLML
jgi:hypothetical protein